MVKDENGEEKPLLLTQKRFQKGQRIALGL